LSRLLFLDEHLDGKWVIDHVAAVMGQVPRPPERSTATTS
jgi:hypothetical protein